MIEKRTSVQSGQIGGNVSPAVPPVFVPPGLVSGAPMIQTSSIRTVFADYLNLTKPGVMLLLLISTGCPMVLAASGEIGKSFFVRLFFVLLGGALVSGSAAAVNCIWDRDIDLIMSRTKNRPIPAGRLGVAESLFFATTLAVLGLLVFFYFVNPLSAGIALFGHLFYTVVYTMWLKRTTPQNIVIGGAAGAVPPLVGWAAVTGSLNATALYLFLFIFLWTPPHFWALALNKNEDYRRANVPMLPVLRGERETVWQMLLYSLTLLPVTFLLVLSDPQLGVLSRGVLPILSIIFSVQIVLLRGAILRGAEEKTRLAWRVFGYSMVYLALFFLCLVVDSTVI